jgi:hypothetical protein
VAQSEGPEFKPQYFKEKKKLKHKKTLIWVLGVIFEDYFR